MKQDEQHHFSKSPLEGCSSDGAVPTGCTLNLKTLPAYASTRSMMGKSAAPRGAGIHRSAFKEAEAVVVAANQTFFSSEIMNLWHVFLPDLTCLFTHRMNNGLEMIWDSVSVHQLYKKCFFVSETRHLFGRLCSTLQHRTLTAFLSCHFPLSWMELCCKVSVS